MKVIIVDGDKTSLTVELKEYCRSKGIPVEETFTSIDPAKTLILSAHLR